MQKRTPLATKEEAKDTIADAWLEEAFGGDAEFAEATLDAMSAFAEGQQTILLEELRAEVA